MIHKFSTVPLYLQLKSLIIEKIETGEYAQGTRIPSEQELCDLYDISRPTVRQAINELTAGGYLFREKGIGTFVCKPRKTIDLRNYSGFTDSVLDSPLPGQKNILSMEKVSQDTCKRLGEIFTISPHASAEFACIQYITRQDDTVLSANISYIPLSIFPHILADLEQKKTSVDILKGKYPYLPTRARSSLEVVFAQQEDSNLLQIPQGTPLIEIQNILYNKTQQAVEYIIAKYRADESRFIFENMK